MSANLSSAIAVLWCCVNLLVSAAATESPFAIASSVNPDINKPHQLNVSIGLFDAGVPKDTSTHRQLRVFPEVRAVEARFLPFVLREILVDSDEWGAVRVVPAASPGDELFVSGTIIKSDGETLEVQLTATDSTGLLWLDGSYSMQSGIADPENTIEISTSFQNVFRQFASELVAARSVFDDLQLRSNREIALLRYAGNLLPDAYAPYLARSPEGIISINRLPANGDPMIERIRRIREFEYLFIDAIDEQYQALYSDIAQTYNLWLRYQERLTRYRLDGELERQQSVSSGRRGSFNAMRQSYEQYKWLKMEEQNLRNWARGFRNEVDPTVVEVEGRIVKLDGSLEQRYEEWSDILRAMLEAETGGVK